jgi:hypothetical protein
MKYAITVIPNASRNEIKVLSDAELKVYITVTPEKGKANKQLITMMSKYFKVSKSSIEITSGELSRNKIISIARFN